MDTHTHTHTHTHIRKSFSFQIAFRLITFANSKLRILCVHHSYFFKSLLFFAHAIVPVHNIIQHEISSMN